MLFSHRAIKLALASHAHPPFHKEGALVSTAMQVGGGGHGTKQEYCVYNDHVSQRFISKYFVCRAEWSKGGGEGVGKRGGGPANAILVGMSG